MFIKFNVGQSSNFLSNRTGIFMHWDNSWVNDISSCNFQTKLLFLNKVMFSFFSSNFFFFFFNEIHQNTNKQTYCGLKKLYNLKSLQQPVLYSKPSRF